MRAQGFSTALERVYNVANTVDAKTMSLQYFDTLKSLGSSPSTKFIFPMEFTSMLSTLPGHGQQPAVGQRKQQREQLGLGGPTQPDIRIPLVTHLLGKGAYFVVCCQEMFGNKLLREEKTPLTSFLNP